MKHSLRVIAGLILLPMLIVLSGCGSITPAKVIATIPVGQSPIAVATNPATNRIYVLNQCCSPGSVSVIDGLTNSVVATVPVGGSPCQVAVNSNTNTIYVTNSADQSVTVIDGATNGTTTVAVGSQPCALAVNPTTNKVYVGNDAGATVIDGASNNTATITLGAGSTHIAVNSVTNHVYISVGQAPEANVTALDGATNQILKAFPLGEFTPESIAVNTMANETYVLENFYHASGALIIDGATLQTSGVLGPDRLTDQLGGPSDTIGLNAKANKVYLLYPDTLYEFDRATKEATFALPTSQIAANLMVDAAINQVYVLIIGEADPFTPGSVMVIDDKSYATTTLPVGFYPSALALNSSTHRVYVANRCGGDSNCHGEPVAGTVSVIEAAH